MMISPVSRVDHVERDLLAEEDVRERLGELLVQLCPSASCTPPRSASPGASTRSGESFSSRDFLARGNLHVHDDAVGAGRNGQRGVLHVRGLFTEDGAEQALFRREFGFGLRRDFADEDVARLHFRTDANDAVGAEVAQRFFTDVRDVARDFFRPELRVASADLEFLDVDRGVDVLLDAPSRR